MFQRFFRCALRVPPGPPSSQAGTSSGHFNPFEDDPADDWEDLEPDPLNDPLWDPLEIDEDDEPMPEGGRFLARLGRPRKLSVTLADKALSRRPDTMIALSLVQEAERLLAEGQLSQRRIAATVGISRATVGAIAAGKRPDYEARRAARAGELEPLGPPARCPTCGGMVYTPCQLCRVRLIKNREEEVARTARRQARQRAARRLLAAVANHQREEPPSDPYLPVGGSGPSDCK